MGPRLSGAQIVDFQLKLRFLINAPAQSQAVFALFSGGLQGQHQLGAWPGLVGDLPGGLLLQGRQTIDEDHAVAPLGDGLPQHSSKLRWPVRLAASTSSRGAGLGQG